jgi:Kef-type K+ transport system membrane component KefB
MESTLETSSGHLFVALGGILLLGLLTSAIGRRTSLPRVTLLLLFGLLIGGQGLDLIPDVVSDKFEWIAQLALLMVGFLLGGKLTRESLQQSMGTILWISVVTALVTTGVVTLGLMALSVPLGLSILLGCVASATAPAAILDVVMESAGDGRFKQQLLSIVALDDAWALLLFACGVAFVQTLNGHLQETSSLLIALWDIGGAVMLGVVLGWPAALLTGRLKPGKPMLSEALGVVLLCGGVAIWAEVSFLIAAMVLGIMVANLAHHHEYPFHAIEGIEEQFMVVFFVLAGASLDLTSVLMIGLAGIGYVLLRALGKILGARIGAQIAGADEGVKNWMGVALLPQAGVAIGMALVASGYFPEYREVLLPLVIGTTIVFELVGPVFTRLALARATSIH